MANCPPLHLFSRNLMLKFKSACSKFYSFKTALLGIQNNIHVFHDAGHSTTCFFFNFPLPVILKIMAF